MYACIWAGSIFVCGISIDTSYKLCTQNIKKKYIYICKNAIIPHFLFAPPDHWRNYIVCLCAIAIAAEINWGLISQYNVYTMVIIRGTHISNTTKSHHSIWCLLRKEKYWLPNGKQRLSALTFKIRQLFTLNFGFQTFGKIETNKNKSNLVYVLYLIRLVKVKRLNGRAFNCRQIYVWTLNALLISVPRRI